MQVANLFAKLGIKADKKTFSQAERMLGAVKQALVGIAAFKTVRWFGSLIDDTAQAADFFSKLSKKVGISTEALQQFEFAAKISGTDIGVLRTGLQRFARTASDAQRGSKMAVDALHDLGVKATDGHGKLRKLDDLLMDVADRFASMPDGTKKTALSMEVFGRAGAELIPFLNEGRKGIGKLRKEFVDLGAQISGDTAKSFEAFNDDQLRVRTALKGIRNQVVIALLPTLKEMTKQMLAWVQANRELIKQRLKDAIVALIVALKGAAKFGAAVVQIIAFMAEHATLTKVALIALAAAFGALKVAAIISATASAIAWIAAITSVAAVSVTAALMSAVAWATAAAPFVLITALVVGLIVVLGLVYDTIKGGDTIFSGMRQALIDIFVGAIEWADKFLGRIGKVIDKAKTVTKLVPGFLTDFSGSKFEKVGARNAGTIAEGRAMFAPKPATRAVAQPVVAPRMNANINVTVPEGADAKAIATKVRDSVQEFWNTQMRRANAATE